MVPIIGSRSIDFTLAALAIWKLGRAYLPIDKSTPVARIDEIIARAGYRVAIRTAPDVCQPTNLRNLLDTYECDLESSGNGSHFDRRAVDQARDSSKHGSLAYLIWLFSKICG
jgi:non-ribosomal peptide synthetase component F